MGTGKMVFISYSSKDNLYADGIVTILKELDVPYWKAPEMIPAGSNYAKEIPKAIRECDSVLLLISKDSQESIWVEKELDSAVNNRKNIVPIRIDEEPLNDMYQFYLNNVQMIPYGLDKEKLMEQLKEHFDSLDTDTQPNPEDVARRAGIRRQNIFTPNKAPLECKYCKGALKEVSRGVYSCLQCGKENYDYFQTIKQYLQEKGSATAIEIERATGIPRKTVDHFFKEGYLEIPKLDAYRATCQRCGAKIRTGTLCDNCNRIFGIRSR